MTTEHAISILRMSEQARWQSGVDHRDVETALDMAAAALRKQDAMKPTFDAARPRAYICPCCNRVIDRVEGNFTTTIVIHPPYCWSCGQKIDPEAGQEATP